MRHPVAPFPHPPPPSLSSPPPLSASGDPFSLFLFASEARDTDKLTAWLRTFLPPEALSACVVSTQARRGAQ